MACALVNLARRQKLQAGIQFLLLCACMLPPIARAQPENTLLVLGDSLSAAHNIATGHGWVELLAQRMANENPYWHVVNASISGETSSGGLARLPSLLQQYQPDLVVLELGANDGLRALPILQLQSNLQAMIGLIRAAGAKVLLLEIQIPDNFGPVYQQRFAEVYRAVAKQHKLPLAPFLLHDVATRPELLQDDGLHPTAAAQPVMLETVWPVLQAMLASPQFSSPG